MPPDLSRVARCVADTRNDDDCCAGKHGTATAAGMPGRADSAAWQAMRTPPFQFSRWLAALTTVVADWLAGHPAEHDLVCPGANDRRSPAAT